jgi:hypothetical protein
MALTWTPGDCIFNLFTLPAFDPSNHTLVGQVREVHVTIGWIIVGVAGLHAAAACFFALSGMTECWAGCCRPAGPAGQAFADPVFCRRGLDPNGSAHEGGDGTTLTSGAARASTNRVCAPRAGAAERSDMPLHRSAWSFARSWRRSSRSDVDDLA